MFEYTLYNDYKKKKHFNPVGGKQFIIILRKFP